MLPMIKRKAQITGLALISTIISPLTSADAFTDALTGGKANGDFRLRYESVDQDNNLKDATALTIRSRIGYTTGSVSNFSAMIEFEDVRVVGAVGDYNDGNNSNPLYSTIADPEVTELDQGFVQYKMDAANARFGRQVYKLDNQRFVGDVGWRQDRQTFDAFSAAFTGVEKLNISYAYLYQRNRVFGEEQDIRSKDHLLNASYDFGIGKLTGYAYLLEEDNDNKKAYDTFGVRFSGGAGEEGMKWMYSAEFAQQQNSANNQVNDFDATYMALEGGLQLKPVTIKIGYEVLGSDDGNYGFSTPLATGHKFNGWADQFLNTPNSGLQDLYASVGGKIGAGKWGVIYHDYKADETKNVDNLGSELDLVYSHKFAEHYDVGIKYAAYSAGDDAAGKVDTNKLWVWVGAKF